MKTLAGLLFIFVSSAAGAQAACTPDTTTACLLNGRMQVEVSYNTNGARFVDPAASTTSGSAQVQAQAGFPNDSTAAFSFYDADQVDALVTVLNGCAINNHYWVFIPAATDSATTVTVTDTSSGAVAEYVNPAGSTFTTVTDTAAFQTCGAVTSSDTTAALQPSVLSSCGSTFCLQGGRYGLNVAYTLPGGQSGSVGSSLTTDHSAVGFLFQQTSPELVSTVIDGRADNGAFWFLTSAASDSELIYTLTDNTTALTNTYVDPLGRIETLLDRGQPISPSITSPVGPVSPRQLATFRLTLTNTAPTDRGFSLSIATPAGASNPAYTCTPVNGATCPGAAGTGPLVTSGVISAGGELVYDYSVTVGAQGAAPDLTVETNVTTAAHALAAESSQTLSASVAVAAGHLVAIPINANWMLVLLVAGMVVGAGLSLTNRLARLR